MRRRAFSFVELLLGGTLFTIAATCAVVLISLYVKNAKALFDRDDDVRAFANAIALARSGARAGAFSEGPAEIEVTDLGGGRSRIKLVSRPFGSVGPLDISWTKRRLRRALDAGDR